MQICVSITSNVSSEHEHVQSKAASHLNGYDILPGKRLISQKVSERFCLKVQLLYSLMVKKQNKTPVGFTSSDEDVSVHSEQKQNIVR